MKELKQRAYLHGSKGQKKITDLDQTYLIILNNLTNVKSRDFLKMEKLHSMIIRFRRWEDLTEPVFTCANLTIETLEQGMKYVQS